MTWEAKCPVEVFNKYINSISCVVKEAYLTANVDHGVFATAINTTNVVYVDVGFPIPVGGESASIPVDFFKVSSSMPSTGELDMKYDGSHLICKVDKSKFKFPIFAKTAIRDPKKMVITPEHIIIDLTPKVLHDAVNKIINYNTDTAALFYKILFEIRDGEFYISDKDENVVTEICDVSQPNASVVVSSDYISSILLFMKKYIEGGISIGITTDKILALDHRPGDAFLEYRLAPIVEVD